MPITSLLILTVIVFIIAVLIRIKWTNIEITRQGCHLAMPVSRGFNEAETISEYSTFQDGYGLALKTPAPTVIDGEGSTVTVYQLRMARIPYTNIRVGWVYFVMTQPDGLSVGKRRITSIGPKVHVG